MKKEFNGATLEGVISNVDKCSVQVDNFSSIFEKWKIKYSEYSTSLGRTAKLHFVGLNNVLHSAEKRAKKTFDDVQGAEGHYSKEFSDLAEAIEGYKKKTSALRLALGRQQGGLTIELNADGLADLFASDSFLSQLNSLTNEHLNPEYEISKYIGQLMKKNPDGSIEYNWEKINELLGKNGDDVSPYECEALATIFLSMESDQDVERFITAGYRFDYSCLVPQDCCEVYAQTDTMKAVITLVVDEVSQLAIRKEVWSQSQSELSDTDKKMIDNLIEKMQIMQIIATMAKSMPWATSETQIDINARSYELPFESALELAEASSVIKIHRDSENPESSIKIQYATHCRDLPGGGSFAMSKQFVVGVNGTGTVKADCLEDDIFKNVLSTYLGDWNLIDSGTNSAVSLAKEYASGSIMKFLPKAVATFSGPAISFISGVAEEFMAYKERLSMANQYMSEYNHANGLELLGARVSYTELDDKIVLHWKSFNETEVTNTIDKFKEKYKCKLSEDDLIKIILSGGRCEEEIKSGYPNSTILSEDQKKEIYEQFYKFRNYDDNN